MEPVRILRVRKFLSHSDRRIDISNFVDPSYFLNESENLYKYSNGNNIFSWLPVKNAIKIRPKTVEIPSLNDSKRQWEGKPPSKIFSRNKHKYPF